MRNNQMYVDGRLYRFDYSGAGPPWPMQVWNDAQQTWEAIGSPPPPATSPLVAGVRLVLAADWLVDQGNDAVVTSLGEGISTGQPMVAEVPDFVFIGGDIVSA